MVSELGVSDRGGNVKLRIAGFVLLTFLGYLCIGLPLAVLPIYIHKTLGYSELVTGIVVSIQYATTFLLRGYGGKIVDTRGPKLAVKISMSAFAISGLLLLLAFYFEDTPWLSLLVMVVGRLLTGCAEGLIGASPINWAMLSVGDKHTATAISFNGIASYGALAVGAPLGVIIQSYLNLDVLALLVTAVGLFGLFYALPKKAEQNTQHTSEAESLSFFTVLRIVAPYGICLGLAGIGFGGISNFITLYYDYFHWEHAALSLSVFSVLFVCGRVFFSKYIDLYGGIKVGICCIVAELIGLILLFFAREPSMALFGSAIAGLGFSLVFPALGVEAVHSAPPANAGASLAGYGLFIDISLGITGPLAGGVINIWGMPYLYAFCSVALLFGLILILVLQRQKAKAY